MRTAESTEIQAVGCGLKAVGADNGRPIITAREVMAMIGRSRPAANRLINTLEAAGLKRKGIGRGTHYDRAEFLKLYAKMDNRP